MKKEFLNLNAVSLWTGVRVGFIPPTPTFSDGIVPKPDRVSECALFKLAMDLGMYIMAYKAEKSGAMVHNVIPIPGKENTFSNAGTCKFPMHVEAPQDPNRPDYLALLCLRGDPGAHTSYVIVEDLVKLLHPMIVKRMREPIFELRVGDSWANAGEKLRVAILEGDSCRMNLGNMRALDERGAEVLRDITQVLESTNIVKKIALQTGDLLLINNHRVVHGRDPFKTVYDGSQRWLQRVYLKKPIP